MAYGGRSEIGECSQRCLELFLTCTAKIASLQPHDDSRVEKGLQDEFVRFKLWSANIGVFAVAQASLDFRVRELADVRELFLRELNTVECRLEQCMFRKILGYCAVLKLMWSRGISQRRCYHGSATRGQG